MIQDNMLKSTFFPLLILLFFISSIESDAQISKSNTDLQTGFSVPEFVHLGVGFLLNENSRFNMYFGTMPDFGNSFLNNYSITAGFSFYFGRINEKRQSKKWAFNPEFSFLKDESKYYIWKYLYLNGTVSYDCYLSDKIILQPELGIIVELIESEKEKPGAGSSWFGSIGPDSPVLPSLGLRLKFLL